MLQQNGDKSQRYSQKKLINDFRKRVDYVTHVENLQFYLKHGMKLEKVTEIISFSQSQFAKKFVKETTQKRHSTQSKVEKAMWKFFNNVLFGKSLQDGGKNINVDIMWKSRKSNAKCRSSNFRGRLILDEETVAISSTPPEISRFMAFAVGFSILEFSKLEMYKAWYEKICPQFPTAELCTSDTDSFLFSIKSENVYEDLKKIPNFWDFSTLPTEHKHYNGKTANKLGLFKLEVGADKIFACACRFFSESIPKKMMLLKTNIIHFAACRPKVYSADTIPWRIWKKYESGEKVKCMHRMKKIALKRCKGVKKHLIRQEFTHRGYERAILTGKPRFVKYFSINSRCHRVGTYMKGKLGLSGKTHFYFQ